MFRKHPMYMCQYHDLFNDYFHKKQESIQILAKCCESRKENFNNIECVLKIETCRKPLHSRIYSFNHSAEDTLATSKIIFCILLAWSSNRYCEFLDGPLTGIFRDTMRKRLLWSLKIITAHEAFSVKDGKGTYSNFTNVFNVTLLLMFVLLRQWEVKWVFRGNNVSFQASQPSISWFHTQAMLFLSSLSNFYHFLLLHHPFYFTTTIAATNIIIIPLHFIYGIQVYIKNLNNAISRYKSMLVQMK